jgi:membrane-associated phospholipid phosphatase
MSSGPPGSYSRAAGRVPRLASIGLLAVGWALLTGLLVAGGELVVHSTGVTAWDRHVTSLVVSRRSPSLDAAMKVVTWLGSWVALVVTAGLLVALRIVHKIGTMVIVVAVLAWIGQDGGTTLAKYVVDRQRPPRQVWLVNAHGPSWPSGHTAVATLVFTTLTAVVLLVCSRLGVRFAAVVASAVAVAAVGFSRVELGVHWTTDVIASVVFMGAWLGSVGAMVVHTARDDEGRSPGPEVPVGRGPDPTVT